MADEIETTALTLIPPSALPILLAADADDILGRLRVELDGFTPDATTPKGRQEIGSKKRKLGTARQDFIRLANTVTESHKQIIAKVREEVKTIDGRIDDIIAQIERPLVEYNEMQERRVRAHRDALAEIKSWAIIPAGWPSGHIATRIEECTASSLLDREWDEFKTQADETFKASINALKVAEMDARQREAAEAEAARIAAEEAEQRRIADEQARREREARIAAEAAEVARIEAERRAAEAAKKAEEQAAREREAAAERERQAAEALVRAQEEAARQEAEKKAAVAAAERQRQEAERQIAEAAEAARKAEAARQEEAARKAEAARQAEAARIAEENAARQRNVAHRKQINGEVVADLIAVAGMTDEMARAIVVAVAKGQVRHARISY